MARTPYPDADAEAAYQDIVSNSTSPSIDVGSVKNGRYQGENDIDRSEMKSNKPGIELGQGRSHGPNNDDDGSPGPRKKLRY